MLADSKAAFISASVDERLGGTASTASNRLIVLAVSLARRTLRYGFEVHSASITWHAWRWLTALFGKGPVIFLN